MDSDSYLIILEIFMSANLQALHRFHEANSVDIGAIVAEAEPPGPDDGAIIDDRDAHVQHFVPPQKFDCPKI